MSSIVKLGYQDNFKLVYLFTKRFRVDKNTNQVKTNQQNKSKQTKTKRQHFLAQKNF